MAPVEVSQKESLSKIEWSEKSLMIFDLNSDSIAGVKRGSRWGELAVLGLLLNRFRRSGISVRHFIGAIQECGKKLANDHEYSCIKDLVAAELSKSMGLTYQQVLDILSEYEKSEFMMLCIMFQRPQAGWSALVGALRQQGKRLALASHPLLSLEAIGMGLWQSGLKIEDFDLVSHWERQRVIDPYQDFLRDILSQCGTSTQGSVLITASRRRAHIASQLGVTTALVGKCLDFWDLHEAVVKQKKAKAEMIHLPVQKMLKQAECA